MLRIVILSKNRSQQLRLLFVSLKKFFPIELAERISVFYSYSNDRFKRGYDKLFKENIIPILKNEEGTGGLSTKESIESIAYNTQHRFTLLLTDDSVFYKNCPLTYRMLELAFNDKQVLTFSLRLGTNTYNVDYSRNKIHETPPQSNELFTKMDDELGKNTIKWSWKNRRGGHFGYPIGLDGTIIETSELSRLTKDVEHNNCRSWEGNMSEYVRRFDRDRTVAFNTSCVVNIPVNQVVNDTQLKNGIFCPYSAEILNDLYLDNIVVDWSRLFHQNLTGHGVSDSFKENTFITCDSVQREIRFPFRQQKWYDKLIGKL